MRKVKFPAASPMSWIILLNLRKLYFQEVHSGLEKKASRNGLHIFSPQALSAFPLAIAAWEALINETFTSDSAKYDNKNNIFYEISDLAERWDLTRKTIEFPKFLYSSTFDTSENMFGDFQIILQIRNNIVHYKHSLYEGPEKPIKALRQRGISYPKSIDHGCPWHMEICSTEVIRFCVNTISEMVSKLSDIAYSHNHQKYREIVSDIYKPILMDEVELAFRKMSASTTEVCNDIFSKK